MRCPTCRTQPILLRLLGQSYFYVGEDKETGRDASRDAYLKASATMQRLDRVDPVPKTTPAYIAHIAAASLYQSGQYADASVDLARAETFPENSRMALQMRAVAALTMNQLNMADYFYRRLRGRFGAIALEPAELLARGLETGKTPVIVRFLEVIRLRGDADTAVLKVLALAYIRNNRVTDAITVLKQSAAMNPNDPETQLLLGDTHLMQGNTDAARGYYAAHLRLSPKSGFIKDIEAKVGKVN